MTPPAPLGDRLATGPHALADLDRGFEDGADADGAADDPVRADGLEPGRRDAAALRAVGIASKLTGRDAPSEIGRNGCRGSRKGAARRIRWRIQVSFQGFLGHGYRQLGKFFAQDQEFLNDATPHLPWKNFVTRLADLRREDTYPNLSCFFLHTPECEELTHVAWAFRHLARDRAMWSDQVSLDILQNTFIGRRLAARVMFGRQAVDGNHDVEISGFCPFDRNRPNRAGDELDVHPTFFDKR